MLKSSGIVGLPLTVVFLVTGLEINLVQFLSLVAVWPWSPALYRKINAWLVNLHWIQLVWLVESFGNTKIRFFGSPEVYEAMKKKSGRAIVLSNHNSGVDWLIGWVMANRFNCLGGTKALMKNSTKYVPVIGWSWWFLEYIFLNRDYNKDKKMLEHSFAQLRTYSTPFWLTIFLEGTRFTAKKHKESNEVAKSKGYTELQHLLLPRPKGFQLCMEHLQQDVDWVYDCTLAYPSGAPPSMADLICGRGGAVDIHFRAFKPISIPSGEKENAEWCRELWKAKDLLLQQHAAKRSFEGPEFPVPKNTSPANRTMLLAALSTLCVLLGLPLYCGVAVWTICKAAVAVFGRFYS